MSLDLNYEYLDRVRRIAALYTKRKTSDLLDGDFSSMQHGRSLDFDDLREYRYGDDINYIDWKSSSRVGKPLVRRYFADRKHDVLFIGDTGKKMTGDTPAGESKEHIALMTLGVAAYILGKQGVNYALSYCTDESSRISSFTSGPSHLEELLGSYRKAIECGTPKQSFYDTLLNSAAIFSRHMIMIIITDAEGLAEMDAGLIKRLIYYNDVYIFKIEDALLTATDVYDLDADDYVDPFLAMCRDLYREEVKLKEDLDKKAEKLLTPHRIFFKSISKEEEIVDTLIYLFRRRKGIT
ncbi:MAG: DUF58 domain-containing protein [Lachnospiraceae bacterium]|nr:DUF58 domain-containing protein [Lachnospiraceae bacterium]